MNDLISRQAAIDAIDAWRREYPLSMQEPIDDCWNAVKELPTVQPEVIRCKDCKWKQGAECVRFADVRPFPSDFLQSCRKAGRMTNLQAINLLNGLEQRLDDYCELNNEGKAAFRMAITALELFGNAEQLPSAQPKRGRWINGKCSECSGHAPFWAMASTYYESNFCPNCGARMDEE